MESYLYRQALLDRTTVALRRLCWICAIVSMLTLIGWVLSFAWMLFVVFAAFILIIAVLITLGTILLREDFREMFAGLADTAPADILIPLYEWLSAAVPVCCALSLVCGAAALVLALIRREHKSPVGTIVSVLIALVLVLSSAALFYTTPYFGLQTGGAA